MPCPEQDKRRPRGEIRQLLDQTAAEIEQLAPEAPRESPDTEPLRVGDLLSGTASVQARLVTLAACESAVTSGRSGGDETISFPAAVLRAHFLPSSAGSP